MILRVCLYEDAAAEYSLVATYKILKYVRYRTLRSGIT